MTQPPEGNPFGEPNPYSQAQAGGFPPGPPGGYPAMTPAYGGPPPSSGYPVQLAVEYPSQSSRILALFSIPFFLARLVMLIPVFICLYFVQIAAFVVAWFAQWAIVFSGQYPEGMHRFVTGTVRWGTRANAYMLGLTDKYPPFSTQP